MKIGPLARARRAALVEELYHETFCGAHRLRPSAFNLIRETAMAEAMIFDAIRTPRGRGKSSGALYDIKPVNLLAGALNALAARHDLDTSQVDDVVIGCVSPIGEQGACIGKTAALAAGWDWKAAGFQLNRFCGSGLEAVNLAAQKIRSDWEDLVVAGGVESMSRVPIGSDGGPWAQDPETSLSTHFIPQGISADLIATLEGFTREQVDAFAMGSHKKAAAARAAGYFNKSIVPVFDRVGLAVLEQDETIRPGTTMEALAALQVSFEQAGKMGFDAVALQKYPQVERIRHIHTAGNSSGIVDGAAAILIGSEKKGRELGLAPRGRVVSAAITGADPTIMLTGPAPAARKALARARMTVDQIDLFEVNEAFAVVPMKFMKELGVPAEKVNVNGGAIAMGHPLGASGAMILGTLLDELERRKLRYGLATLCIGGGMGIATIIERL
jgi:acetyl-CoA C-acetyltransferase